MLPKNRIIQYSVYQSVLNTYHKYTAFISIRIKLILCKEIHPKNSKNRAAKVSSIKFTRVTAKLEYESLA